MELTQKQNEELAAKETSNVLAIARGLFGERAAIGYASKTLGWIRPSEKGDFWVGVFKRGDKFIGTNDLMGRGHSWLEALANAATNEDGQREAARAKEPQ